MIKSLSTRTNKSRLFLLGLISTLIAIFTTCLSLVLYHKSGDIYLDRSRPGFLPEKPEDFPPVVDHNNYTFPDSGALDSTVFNEYIENFSLYLNDLTKLADPFSSDPLSDQSLGIRPATPSSNKPNAKP